MITGFNGILTVTVFLPALGAVLIWLIVRSDRQVRFLAVAVGFCDLVLAVIVFSIFNKGEDADRFQLIDRIDWINTETFNASYLLSVDGLSAPLVLLTGLLGFCALLASFHIQDRVKEYFIWLLILQTAVMGVFTSLDLLLFFLFWELELIPMYMLISVWGSGRREYSAMKFLIFTIFGSAAMLIALVGVFLSGDRNTFDMVLMFESSTRLVANSAVLPISALFWLFFIAFAIKLPTWPLHTWLPDAHTDAPTAASVMLAGVMLKMGGYGLLRINVGLFPDQVRGFAWALVTLGVISIIYGAIVTVKQTDLKRLIAYSSVSHMGLVLLGVGSVAVSGERISSVGLNGAAMQLFTHGTITGLLFLCVGLIYDKAHTRYIPDLGGLANRMPFIAIAFLIAGLASLGLPGLSGFVSEILVFLGTFPAFPWPTVIAVFGIILAAGYILWMMQRTLFGPDLPRFSTLSDASLVEAIPLVLLIISILVIGVYPAILTTVFESGLNPMLEVMDGLANNSSGTVPVR